MFNSWFCRLPPVWSCVLTNVKTTHCLCFTLLMWFWCTSQLCLEWFCVHVVNVSDLIWAVQSLSIKHFHHCILHYNMQTKAAASLLSTAALMMSTCCYRERTDRVKKVQRAGFGPCLRASVLVWPFQAPVETRWQTQNWTCALCRY